MTEPVHKTTEPDFDAAFKSAIATARQMKAQQFSPLAMVGALDAQLARAGLLPLERERYIPEIVNGVMAEGSA